MCSLNLNKSNQMKNLYLAVLLLIMASCGQLHYTIILEDGRLINAETVDELDIVFEPNDTVVLKTTMGRGMRTTIYGKYIGVLPKNTYHRFADSSTYFVNYQLGIILSNK